MKGHGTDTGRTEGGNAAPTQVSIHEIVSEMIAAEAREDDADTTVVVTASLAQPTRWYFFLVRGGVMPSPRDWQHCATGWTTRDSMALAYRARGMQVSGEGITEHIALPVYEH